ncbi:MAG: LacI family DNA-binding transcriptional regulator [Bacteroidales bacterium]|nr:LacI family DNA-binding transcriptional regulator [Bacteroidales bacterium]
MKKTSLNDIANKLGVSKSLVSLVLNGKAKQNRIGDEISEKVLKLAKELNYQPNQIARSLRLGRSETIALIVADISNPFFARMGRAVEDEADKFGFKVIFSSSDENPDKLGELLNVLIDRQVDGFIISPTIKSKEYILKLKKNNIPFVLIDRCLPPIKTNSVVVDNYNSTYYAVKFMLEKGYKKTGFITVSSGLSNMKERLLGYKDAMKNFGVRGYGSYIREVDYKNFNESVGEAVKELLLTQNNLRALFFATLRVGMAAIKSINDLKLRIPQDVAVISFDDADAYQIFYPPITAIAQPIDMMSSEAVKILINEIKQKNVKTEKTQIVLPTEFIIRESCC